MNWDPNGPDAQFNSAPLLFSAPGARCGSRRQSTRFRKLGCDVAVVNSAAGGAPIPDLVVALHKGSVATELLSIQASITGQLHAPEFTEGAAGRLGITEIGPIQAHNSKAGPLSDGYPVEEIDLTPLGH
jgi:hypothetical protein